VVVPAAAVTLSVAVAATAIPEELLPAAIRRCQQYERHQHQQQQLAMPRALYVLSFADFNKYFADYCIKHGLGEQQV
jgi:hypothetical protein